MKYYVLVVLAFSIVGCSTNNFHDELAVEIIAEKLSKNGPSMFCDQPEYSACYKITPKQCFTEVSDGSDICTEKTRNKFATISMDNLGEYSEYYGTCIVINHAMKYPNKMEEIGRCLEVIEFDEDKGVRSLFK
jgi:hypothetical protein